MRNQSLTALREAAKRLNDAALSDKNLAIINHYKDINALRPREPAVAVFMPPDAEAALFGSRTTLAESFITDINKFNALGADMPVSRVIYSGLRAEITPWSDGYRTVRANSDGTTSAFKPCIIEYSDLKKLRKPEFILDVKKTRESFEKMRDELGDILDVRWGSPFFMTCGWGESMIDQLVEMRGLENIYFDMEDAPEFVHEAMDFMTNAKLDMLKQYQEQGALICNWDGGNTIGSCSFPFTDELPPASGRDARALWGFAQAQEFAGVSTEMLNEFVLPYQAKIANKFGLLSYGCCEPMDRQIALLLDKFPNLRIVSVSPYSDIEIAAKKCVGRLVMNCKLHPSYSSSFDEGRVRVELAALVRRINGRSATLSFAEIIDYGADPNVFFKLAKIAKEVIDENWTEASAK